MKSITNYINESNKNYTAFDIIVSILTPLEDEGIIEINTVPFDDDNYSVGIGWIEDKKTVETATVTLDVKPGIWTIQHEGGPGLKPMEIGNTSELFDYIKKYRK